MLTKLAVVKHRGVTVLQGLISRRLKSTQHYIFTTTKYLSRIILDYLSLLVHFNEKHIELTESERITLKEGSNYHPKSEFRKKCHGLLLNHSGLSYTNVALYLAVNTNTITNWVKAWETNGIIGLSRKSGQGRQPILKMTTTAHTQLLDLLLFGNQHFK